MITKVQVTQQDIEESQGADIAKCMMCPIDRAAQRLLKEGVSVCTGHVSIGFYSDFMKRESVNLPKLAQEFVVAFDYSDNAQPFEFELDIPEHLLK